jgi:hypothetical protein
MNRISSLSKKPTTALVYSDLFLLKVASFFQSFFSYQEKKQERSLTIKDVFFESVNFRWEEIS